MTPKRRLTQKQTRHIRSNQSKIRSGECAESDHLQLSSHNEEATVIRHMKYQIDVRTASGTEYKCHYRQNLGALVCGDKVMFLPHVSQDTGVITALLPRSSLLTRPGRHKEKKLVAANIDKLFIVIAPKPTVSDLFIDRYLVGAEHFGFNATIVVNKTDLLSDSQVHSFEDTLAQYTAIGYQNLFISAKHNQGLSALKALLNDATSILVGQSGVGKSSLINQLLPEAELDTSPLSDISGLGQHTTSAAQLFNIPSGGVLIDSPGVREFGLDLDKTELGHGFVEFRPFLEQCRFRDCQHLNDKDCAVRQAVNNGQISRSRYQSYKSIYDSL